MALYQGRPLKNPSGNIGHGGKSSQVKQKDPTLYTSAFKKNRFYIFSRREPEEMQGQIVQRDILNERPSVKDQEILKARKKIQLPSKILI